MNDRGLASLLFDVLTDDENHDHQCRFEMDLLVEHFVGATVAGDWIVEHFGRATAGER